MKYYVKGVFNFAMLLTFPNREVSEYGKELVFDHGAPYFTVNNAEVLGLVRGWESRGLVAEWKQNFGSFDCSSNKFFDMEQVCYYFFSVSP